ncbi:phosphatase PAP2 family protein [Candidatus Wolfebacteria bacterium]|nr:phosphatase PAP2 family protein [Candidatus Wolfebacteria bacterium]
MSDGSVFSFLFGLAHKNQLLDWLFVFLASYLIIFLVIVFLYFLFKEKDWRHRFYFSSLSIISVILSRGILTTLIRFSYDRPRPFVVENIQPLIDHAATPSFPSGHIAFILPLALTIWLINRRAGWWFLIAALFIGLGRVAIGIHWPSDIFGGILIGSISFFSAYYLLKWKGVSGKHLTLSITPFKSSADI